MSEHESWEGGESQSPPSKRLRTKRACDYCREHRIKCESREDQNSDVCKHCHQYGIVCKKVAQAPRDTRPRASKKADPLAELKKSYSQGIEPGYLGPTNLSQQIRDHCLVSVSGSRKLQMMEDRLDLYGYAFERHPDRGRLVGRDPGIGETARRRAVAAATYSRVLERLIESVGSESVLHDLLATCQHTFLPLHPAVSVHETLGPEGPSPDFFAYFGIFHINSSPPTPLPRVLRLALCAIPAMSRDIPLNIRNSLMTSLNTALDAMDFSLGMATLSNIQLHLVMSVNDALWKRGPLGRAVYGATRMAVGLALHRGVSLRVAPLSQIQRRARIWGACIIAERWMTLRLGQMPSIDLTYADAPFPSAHPDHLTPENPGLIPCFRFHLEMTKLADLLGRAYDLCCTPFGLERADVVSLLSWQMDYEAWRDQLPDTWPYSYRLDIPHARQILNLLCVAVLYSFVQPLLWPVQPIPELLTYRPPDEFLSDLMKYTSESIEWACGAGAFYLDIWSLLFHPFICCLIVQAKAARLGDFAAKCVLDRGIQVIRDWAEHGESQPFVTYKREHIVEMVELLQDQDRPDLPWDILMGVQ